VVDIASAAGYAEPPTLKLNGMNCIDVAAIRGTRAHRRGVAFWLLYNEIIFVITFRNMPSNGTNR
jgi:hypothetical protein